MELARRLVESVVWPAKVNEAVAQGIRRIEDLAAGLAGHGVEIVSTGGTAAKLRATGTEVRDISDLTGFPEMVPEFWSRTRPEGSRPHERSKL